MLNQLILLMLTRLQILSQSDIKCEEVIIKEEVFSEDYNIYDSTEDIDPLMCCQEDGHLIVDETKRPDVPREMDRNSEVNNFSLLSISSPYNTRKKNKKLKSSYSHNNVKLTSNNIVLRKSPRSNHQNLKTKFKKIQNIMKKKNMINIDEKNKMKKDEFSIFGDYVACCLRNLNDKYLQASTQWKICNMLCNVNLSLLNKQ